MTTKPKQWHQHITSWRFQDKYKSKIMQVRSDVQKAFTEHPESTGESYPQHLWFTIRMASRFAYVCLVILIHGLFPFLCTRTASNQIETVYRIMKTRIPQKRRQEIDKEFQRTVVLRIDNGEARVAIIGGGFSGTMVLANIIRQASGPLTIEWFEKESSVGTGVAYATKDITHLLNVRADRMGAYAGLPDHFYQWLQSEEGAKASQSLIPGHTPSGNDFVPRALYAEYLRSITRETLAEAKNKDITVRVNQASVLDASIHDSDGQQIMLGIERGGNLQRELLVDAVVLATGNLPPRSFHFQTGLMAGEQRYVEDVWNPPADHVFPKRINELPASAEIVIIGAGLTMVDTVLTLKSRGFKGTITAISRNGFLPQPHAKAEPYPAWEWVLAPQFAPKTALGLLVRLRQEIKRAEAQGYGWRSVIDSIRPVTQDLWKQLNTAEKRKFLSRLFTLWNVHRHRMAPEINEKIRAMQQSGGLSIIAGKIYYVGSDKEGLTVAYRKRGTNRVETLRPALVINCTGPEYDIAASDHALLRSLRDRELITVGPLRAGIETTDYGTAKGQAPDAIFPIGVLMVGELLECTAVPELREQAQDVASKVIERIRNIYEPEYRANMAVGQGI